MSTAELTKLKERVKEYIDNADESVVMKVYDMIDADAEADDEDWWDTMPDEVRRDVELAIEELDNGEGIPHAEVKKMYPQWFTK